MAKAPEPDATLEARAASLNLAKQKTGAALLEATADLKRAQDAARQAVATGGKADYPAVEAAERAHREAERADAATGGAFVEVSARLEKSHAEAEEDGLLVRRDQTIALHEKADAAFRRAIVDLVLAGGEVEATHARRKAIEGELRERGWKGEPGSTRSPLESHWVGDFVARGAREEALARLGGGEVRLLGNLHLYLPLLAK